MENGLHVSFPLLNTSVYDCIVESEKGLQKIQIKAIDESKRTKNQIMVKNGSNKYYKKKDIDFFAFYSKKFEGFFIVKNEGDLKCFTPSLKKYSKNFNNFALL